jgi:CRP-like cAMP-binding protein
MMQLGTTFQGHKCVRCRQAIQSDPACADNLWYHRTCLDEGTRALQRAQVRAARFGLVSVASRTPMADFGTVYERLTQGGGMARGRKTSLTIRLTPAERLTLLAWQRATTLSAGLARRARILLLLADGMTITDIAATVGLSRPHTYKWIQRFVQEGLEGLEDKPGRGRHRGPRPPDLREQPEMEVG